MISVDDFLAQNTPRSALKPFHDAIVKLRAAKMSYQKIQAFLALNGLDTHVNNVRGYCQRHIEKSATKKSTSNKKLVSKKAAVKKPINKQPSAKKKHPTNKVTIPEVDERQTSLF